MAFPGMGLFSMLSGGGEGSTPPIGGFGQMLGDVLKGSSSSEAPAPVPGQPTVARPPGSNLDGLNSRPDLVKILQQLNLGSRLGLNLPSKPSSR